MRLQPRDRSIYTQGHSDGERGLPPRSRQFMGTARLTYERGYGKGYDLRYRAEGERRQHGNKGKVR